MGSVRKIKAHFENEAAEYDALIRRLIPRYTEMVCALTNVISFPVGKKIKVMDLGCGTANIALSVKKKYPQARITCLDMADRMLAMARAKFRGMPGIRFESGEFSRYCFKEKYDAIVSSLALHHLTTDARKAAFYGKIFGALKKGGIFCNADIVLAPDRPLQGLYMDTWKKFMSQSISRREAEEKWIPKHREEDSPAPLTRHLNWLKAAGFRGLDVVWKYYGFAVVCGRK